MNDNFFNQNKNFSGGLKGLAVEGEEEKEKESSGLGFEDDYKFYF